MWSNETWLSFANSNRNTSAMSDNLKQLEV